MRDHHPGFSSQLGSPRSSKSRGRFRVGRTPRTRQLVKDARMRSRGTQIGGPGGARHRRGPASGRPAVQAEPLLGRLLRKDHARAVRTHRMRTSRPLVHRGRAVRTLTPFIDQASATIATCCRMRDWRGCGPVDKGSSSSDVVVREPVPEFSRRLSACRGCGGGTSINRLQRRGQPSSCWATR